MKDYRANVLPYSLVVVWFGGGAAAARGTWWGKRFKTGCLGSQDVFFFFRIVCLHGLCFNLKIVLMLLQIPAEPDGSRYSLPARSTNEDSGHQSQSQLTTPER